VEAGEGVDQTGKHPGTNRRSENMRRIRSADMKPEMVVRQLVYKMGFRYRLHRKELPGKPDIVFAGRRKIIFVHGCFWHQHPECREGRLPGSNAGYWQPKLARNVERDGQALAALKSCGWSVLVIWECETKDVALLEQRLRNFLERGQVAKKPG
jgi:DNA mismatch endonuclease, patch repair protein